MTAVYAPLIDMTPSNPDTIMSAMIETQRLTNECGQTITVFTNGQQRTSYGCTHDYSSTLCRDYEAPRDGHCNSLKGGGLPLSLWAVAEMLPYVVASRH